MAHRTIEHPSGYIERVVVGGVRDRELRAREAEQLLHDGPDELTPEQLAELDELTRPEQEHTNQEG